MGENNARDNSQDKQAADSQLNERIRTVYEARERARRENSALEDEIRLKAKIDVAKNLLKMGLTLNETVKATELPRAIVEEISKSARTSAK
jgi:hypothetical protein